MGMKILRDIRMHVRRLLRDPSGTLGHWGSLMLYQVRLWRHCGRTLRRNNASAMSAALSFKTIFALIPALVLALLAAKSVGALDQYRRSLRGSLEAAGLQKIRLIHSAGSDSRPGVSTSAPAAAGDSVGDWIERIAGDVEKQLTFERLGPIGVALFVWTALTLLVTIEQSLNRIFGADRSRSLGRRMLLYWSVLTLGPILLSVVTYLADSASTVASASPTLSWLWGALIWSAPVLVGVGLLAGLYKLMPNTRVRFRAAVGGALVAVPLWLVAKWAFMLYVTKLTGSLYGALGLLPLFLVWVNMSWWIFLFGAQLAYTAANLRRLQADEDSQREVLTAWDLLSAALSVAMHYHDDDGPRALADIAADIRLTERSTRSLLDRLTAGGVLAAVEADAPGSAFVPARPLERIKVADLLDLSFPPESAPGAARSENLRIQAGVVTVCRRAAAGLGDLTMADVLCE